MTTTCVLFSALFVSLAAAAQNPVFQPQLKAQRVTVRVIAVSYRTTRSTVGEQDAYLAEFVDGPDHYSVVRLLDRFREVELPISSLVLKGGRRLAMRVVRDESCDETAEELTAMLRPEDIYDLPTVIKLDETPQVIVPCFRAIHRTIRLQRRGRPVE